MADVESLELQITGDASKAKAGLDALIDTLEELKNKVKGGVGLTSVANQVRKMADAAGKMNGSEGAKLESLAKGLQALSGLGNIKLSSSIANQVSALGTAVRSLDGADFTRVEDLAVALAPLETLGKSKLGSFLNQLKKLPEVATELNNVDMDTFKTKIQEVTASIKPLADEMQKVANGFSAFPEKIQEYIRSSSKMQSSNASSGKSFKDLATKVVAAVYSLKKMASVIASWVNESNEYIENINLFSVSMGEYAESAMEYANAVSEVMGIDPSDWIRNQGVFMTLATGFGVATDRAATMSKQLTQLGYDISSFYNTSVEDAMQRLQSGLSGELEPLRRLGYDLSQAKLEAVALSLGIDKAVSSMTQAEKAQLRYYAIMTQVTTAHGDMARTLDAPSNQLRVFKAQLEQAARALGNIFIPALNAILPYGIAALKVIRELANAVADLFGFTLPEVDYSGLVNVGDTATDVSDALDEATGSATKLKKTLLGIDEINVMGNTNSGENGSASGGSGFQFDIPTYDFMGEINTNIDDAYKTIKKLVSPIKKIIKMLWEYKEIVGLGLGSIVIGKLWDKLKALWEWFSGLKLVNQFLSGFNFIYETGAGVLKSVDAGIADVRNSLTGMQKAAIVAVAGFAEFAVVENNIREIAMGCDDVIGNIVEIGVVVGAAAAAMYVALGPAGLAVAGCVALVGAIAGVTKAQNEMMTAMSNEVFYSGTGAKISDLADGYSSLMNSIVATHQPIIDNQGKIDDLRGSVEKASSSIDGIGRALTIGSATASEKIDEIKALFGQLESDTKTIMEEIYNNIVNAISGSFGTALVEAGYSIPEIMEFLKQLRGEGENTLDSLMTELEELNSSMEAAEITQDEYANRYTEIKQKMLELTGATSEYTGVFNTLKDSIGNIDWEDATAKENFFTQVTSSSTEAKTAINDMYDALINDFETAKQWSTDPVVTKLIDDLINVAESDRHRQLQSVDNELTSLYDAIQEDIILKTAGVKEKATQEWNDMNWFEQMWNGGNEAKYVQAQMSNYRKNIATPVSNAIDESFEKLGVDGSAWADEAMTSVLDTLFDTERVGNSRRTRAMVVSYGTGIEDAISKALEDAGKGAKSTATDVGEATGKAYMRGISSAMKSTGLPTLKANVTVGGSGLASLKFMAYANGGFPDYHSAEVFVAREAGPELVGSIGNRNAVVNNDQIVESVSQGVYRAVVQAMGQSGGNQVVEAKVNDKVLFEVVVSRNRQETMRTGYSPLLGGV